jgi:hypothetical protein
MKLVLLDPRFWLIALVVLLGTIVFSYQAGVREATSSVTTAWKAQESKVSAEHATALAAATKESGDKERAMTKEHEGLTAVWQKDKKNDAKTITDLRAALRRGTERLHVGVASCGAATSAGSAASEPGKASAELDLATSEFLVGLTEEGDAAIRDLNLCVDKYNVVRDALATMPRAAQ